MCRLGFTAPRRSITMPMSCTITEHINAPTDKVFAAATDFASAPQRISGIKKMEMLTDGPVGKGTKFRETRVMFGKEASETMEVVDFQPGRSYTLAAASHGCAYSTVVSVRPAARGGSEVTFDFSGKPLTTGARIMGTLMGWMFKGACVKAIKKDLTDLKTWLESPAVG